MIRRFCDLCGAEMTERNTPFGGSIGRMGTKLKRLDCVMTVEVITGRDSTSNAGDFCKHCILDALQELDDRPKPTDRRDIYSELGDALGSDPMDSHEGRLARAKRARLALDANRAPNGALTGSPSASPGRTRG